MRNTLDKINHSVWELNRLIKKEPENFDLRKDFLRYFHESRAFVERRRALPDDSRSFLLMQERETSACLLIHGAGGTPAEMRPLGEYLHRLGYTVYGIRLSFESEGAPSGAAAAAGPPSRRRGVLARHSNGNGYSWSRCLIDATTALEALTTYSGAVYLAGFSFGGTIALDLLQRRPVRGAILLSPALFPVRNWRGRVLDLAHRVAPSALARIYPREEVMLEYLERTRGSLKPISQPILVVQAARERVLSPRGLQLLKRLASHERSRFVLLESDRHVIVTGDDAARVYSLCGDFLREA